MYTVFIFSVWDRESRGTLNNGKFKSDRPKCPRTHFHFHHDIGKMPTHLGIKSACSDNLHFRGNLLRVSRFLRITWMKFEILCRAEIWDISAFDTLCNSNLRVKSICVATGYRQLEKTYASSRERIFHLFLFVSRPRDCLFRGLTQGSR